MPKISVIIPVYKVEKYIERCVRGLFESDTLQRNRPYSGNHLHVQWCVYQAEELVLRRLKKHTL
ncbi:hypothetical protein SAMN04487899_11916 [Segatella bryantii]|nr:hypothetical protein SAMN04487899_11916 [Segatella bryantii]